MSIIGNREIVSAFGFIIMNYYKQLLDTMRNYETIRNYKKL